MNVHIYPSVQEWPALLSRPKQDPTQLHAAVEGILERVRREGDDAVREYERTFDKADLSSLCVSDEEMAAAHEQVDDELRHALELAHENIRRFHEAQRFAGRRVETQPGIVCWQKAVPIERVGLYVPGGRAPLFSTVLMLATPAVIAGCKDIVLCSPPNAAGELHPAIIEAARIAGVRRLFKCGGVQAIGAMAYGTESIPRVDKIFGPGNQYVTAAKQIVSMQGTAIDMPAGPSEVCVVADRTSNPQFVAADLLSQAEHGPDSQALLICTDEGTLRRVLAEVDAQLSPLPRRDIAAQSLAASHAVLVHNAQEAVDLANAYAPEHLILAVDSYETLADQVVNAGSVFLGHYACESAGDYASGTNHTLPTNGYARAYSGVSLDSFIRKITFQHITPEGIRRIGHAVERMAENEQLQAHRNAMTVRIESIR